MAEDEIVVYYGETTKVIGKFEAGSRGLDVLEVVETMTTEKGSVVFCANGRAVTKGSRNLVAGSYRFDAAPAPTPAPTPENSGGDEFWEALKVILLGPAWPTTTEVWTGIKRFNSMMSGGFKECPGSYVASVTFGACWLAFLVAVAVVPFFYLDLWITSLTGGPISTVSTSMVRAFPSLIVYYLHLGLISLMSNSCEWGLDKHAAPPFGRFLVHFAFVGLLVGYYVVIRWPIISARVIGYLLIDVLILAVWEWAMVRSWPPFAPRAKTSWEGIS